jgi:hypothetical protein
LEREFEEVEVGMRNPLTENVDSDFEDLVPSRALSIEDVTASVVQLAVCDHQQ